MVGKCSCRKAGLWCEMSRCTQSRPCFFISKSMARATMSRGASSARSSCAGMKRVPSGSSRRPPSPRTASLIRKDLASRVVQAGRVELDELHVRDPAARAPGHRDAVAGGGVGIGGVEVDLAGAAGRQHGVRCAEGEHLVGGLVEHVQALAARCSASPSLRPVIRSTSVCCSNSVMLGRAPHLLDQRALHRGAGGVGRMHDAALAVAAFAREVQRAVLEREGHAEPAQPGDGLGRMLDHEARGGQVAEARARHQRVVDVRLHAVAIGRAPLAMPPWAHWLAPSSSRALGDDGHAMRGCEMQCGAESGQAAADDEHVEFRKNHRSSLLLRMSNGANHNRLLRYACVHLRAPAGVGIAATIAAIRCLCAASRFR